MAYDVELEPSVLKDLRGITAIDQARIVAKIESLGETPRPHGVEKLTAVDGYRVRVGDYRIVYRIDDLEEMVIVTRVSHRSDVYRRR